jgi:3',5'-cyclic AMP phosphodiesterase CpdA
MLRSFIAALLLGLVGLVPGGLSSSVSARGRSPKASIDPKASSDPTPTAIPDRIILTWAGDPATTQAVTWRTSGEVTEAYAEIARADASPEFVREAVRHRATTEALHTESGEARYHSVQFTDLAPNTLYAYRVGSERWWSEWFHFRTARSEAGPFSFLYFGDAQNNILAMWSPVLRAAYAAAPDARFSIHAGDLVDDGDEDSQWDEWFRAGGWLHAMVPSIPAIGNHEYDGDETPGANWRAQYTLPENGVSGLEELNYFIDYESLRVVVLDSNVRLAEQAAWLENTLRDNPMKWTVAAFHHPIYSSARDRDNPELRDLWKPLFERYGVDLVLQGHDHTYARGRNLPAAGEIPPGEEGPMYVVSVSGPKMYDLGGNGWWDRAAKRTQFFQVISIDSDTLRFEAFTATGELFDSFEIVKPDR